MQTERESKPALMAPTSSTEQDHRRQPHGVVKRKRTKRPRHHPPASSSSSESTTTEEEDMAHCLILLAQGGAAGAGVVDSKPQKSERYTSRRYTEATTTADGVKAGFYVYECRTCNKCFPTFQALGGHRASHKKPRLATTAAAADDEEVNASKQPPMMMVMMTTTPPPPPPRVFPHDVTTALSLNNSHAAAGSSSGSKLRVHECSICGAEFASGQALGGHMRRHRPLNAPERAVSTTVDATKKQGSINLELDLNLPAPSDDPAVVLGLGQFNDGSKAGLMLTASALVDCHY